MIYLPCHVCHALRAAQCCKAGNDARSGPWHRFNPTQSASFSLIVMHNEVRSTIIMPSRVNQPYPVPFSNQTQQAVRDLVGVQDYEVQRGFNPPKERTKHAPRSQVSRACYEPRDHAYRATLEGLPRSAVLSREYLRAWWPMAAILSSTQCCTCPVSCTSPANLGLRAGAALCQLVLSCWYDAITQ